MPKKYEKMRDKFKSQGLSDKAAKGKAARIYNANRPKGAAPVTRAKHGNLQSRVSAAVQRSKGRY